MLYLAGDIGGTNTRLGLFSADSRRPRTKVVETYPSRDAPGLEHLVSRFLEAHSVTVSGACFGIAGPVLGGRCEATNLPWVVSEAALRKRFKLPCVRLLNDLVATATAVGFLRSNEMHALNSARVRKGRNKVLIAPGTGFGASLMVAHGNHLIPVPSEAGHADFAPNTEQETMLWRHLRSRFGHVSVERVVSGPGLVHIYEWVKSVSRQKEPLWLRHALKSGDKAMAIAQGALERRQPLCTRALRMFVSILGAVCGNVVLTTMATGGVYLGGGIPPKILPALEGGPFAESFAGKGRFRRLLEKVAVRVVLNDRAALLGAACCACTGAGEG